MSGFDSRRERKKARKPEGDAPETLSSSAQRSAYSQMASQAALARAVEVADDAVISIDESHRIIFFNEGAARIFGFRPAEVLDQALDVLLPSRFVDIHRRHVGDFAKGPSASRTMGERQEILGLRKNGEEFPAEASISHVEVGGYTVFTVILRDISERKADDERIRSSLREKETLLKEIHHRVKNNLQVVSSLLSLQARAVLDEETRRTFKESQNRIQSMALIHERLYRSDSLSGIDLPEYVRELVANLFRSYRVSSSRVSLQTQVDPIRLTIDWAVPCGLIINELVSNALKHAFPDGRGGEIEIRLRRGAGGDLVLSVADTGVGMPAEVDFWGARTLGLRLVRTLANQLGGKLNIHSAQGVEVTLTFSAAEEKTGADR